MSFSGLGAPATVELDEAKCNSACLELLDAEIVIPNVWWAPIAAMDVEPSWLYASCLGGTFISTELRNSLSGLWLDRGSASESLLRANIGLFLATTIGLLYHKPWDSSIQALWIH
jgi:hypothetical protein